MPRLTGGGAGITIPTVGADAPTRVARQRRLLRAVPRAGRASWSWRSAVIDVAGRVRAARHPPGRGRGGRDGGQHDRAAKTLAFAVSAALTGAIGAAYAFQQVTIFPERLFDVDITVLMVVMVVLGGSGTVARPGDRRASPSRYCLGMAAPATITEVHTFLLGGLIIVAVVLLPQGFITYLARRASGRGGFSLLDNVRRYRL